MRTQLADQFLGAFAQRIASIGAGVLRTAWHSQHERTALYTGILRDVAGDMELTLEEQLLIVDYALVDATTNVPRVFIESENIAFSAMQEVRKLCCLAAPLKVLLSVCEWDESPGVWPNGSVRRRVLPTRDEFAEALRVMTYSPPSSTRVPLLIHRAYEGDYDSFANFAVASNRAIRRSLRFGFLLAITCTEDVSRIDPAAIARETAHTYLGASRVREQIAACDGWPRGALAANYGDPVRSSVPVFLLSGTVDPVAGVAFTAQAARYLSNSIHVIAPGGHVPFGPCIDLMEQQFLETARASAVDTSCVAAMRLPSFVTR